MKAGKTLYCIIVRAPEDDVWLESVWDKRVLANTECYRLKRENPGLTFIITFRTLNRSEG